jgi:hypothetical protein
MHASFIERAHQDLFGLGDIAAVSRTPGVPKIARLSCRICTVGQQSAPPQRFDPTRMHRASLNLLENGWLSNRINIVGLAERLRSQHTTFEVRCYPLAP